MLTVANVLLHRGLVHSIQQSRPYCCDCFHHTRWKGLIRLFCCSSRWLWPNNEHWGEPRVFHAFHKEISNKHKLIFPRAGKKNLDRNFFLSSTKNVAGRGAWRRKVLRAAPALAASLQSRGRLVRQTSQLQHWLVWILKSVNLRATSLIR